MGSSRTSVGQHLDHVADLGVDVLWLSPIYASPQDDNGYDIADYQAIDPLFGTLEDFDELVALLDEYVSDDAVVASLRYKLKKGSTSRSFGWTGPGVVEGSSRTSFTVR